MSATPPVNLPLHFSPDEIAILRLYAATARDVRTGAQVDRMAQQAGVDRTTIINLTIRMRQHGLLLHNTPIGRDYVAPLLTESLHALDSAPKPNKWQNFKTFVERQWWSIPLFVLLGLLTVAATLAKLWTVIWPHK